MKKLFIIFFTFILTFNVVFADDLIGDIAQEVVKEIVYDSLGEAIGYKYVLETGEVFYNFYDEQIDTLIDASNNLMNVSKNLESYVDKGQSGSYYDPSFDIPNDGKIYFVYITDYQNYSSEGGPIYYWSTYTTTYNDCSGFSTNTVDGVKYLSFSFLSSTTKRVSQRSGESATTKITTGSGGNISINLDSSYLKTYLGGGVPQEQRYSWYTNYYDFFTPDSFGSSYLESGHYVGYGDPENDIVPENDPFNPLHPDYDPFLLEDIENGVAQLNLRVKIDSRDIVNAIKDNSFNAEDWFDYLLKNSIWEDEEEENELNDFINQAMINLGVIPQDNFSSIVSISDDDELIVEDIDEDLYSDCSILVYPITILKQFFDAIDDVEVDGTMNFPKIDVRGQTLLEEQEFNFYQMIYDLGLSDLHEMYYLVINAGLTLGLIYYAKRKFAEFQNGQKGDAA